MNKAKKLRELLASGKIVMAPGAYDAWSARMVEQAGFSAVYMTGYGVSASVLGRPDIGLISENEMVTAARQRLRQRSERGAHVLRLRKGRRLRNPA